jgi:single-strand DNA-binding protein
VDLHLDQREELVARFTLLTELKFKKKSGVIRESAEHRVVAWGELARLCGTNLVEGRLVLVEGRLRSHLTEDPRSGCTYPCFEIRAEQVRILDEQ